MSVGRRGLQHLDQPTDDVGMQSHRALAVATAVMTFLVASVSHADAESPSPRYLALIGKLAESSTTADSPASPCPDGWHNRQAGPDFLESGCPTFTMPEDYPHDSKRVQLNLMAKRGQVFAVGLSHEVASWQEAAALATRLRQSLPPSFACQGEHGLLRCYSSGRFLVIGSAEDVPGEHPEASMLYVRDLAAFQAFYANDFPAKAGE